MNSMDYSMLSRALRQGLRPRVRPIVLALFFGSSFALAQNPSVLLAQGVPASALDQASEAAASVKENEEDERLPKMALTEKILYEFLLAEIAGQRGQMAVASEVYFDLAKNTRDPRIVRRAAEVALYARKYPTALEASRMWVAIDPQAKEAQRMLATLLLASGRIDELAVTLARDLENAGPRTGDLLLQQHRVFANYPDKAAVKRLFDQLTQPYAALPEAHLVRAQTALAVNDKAGAVSAVDQALVLRPAWEPAALLKAGLLEPGVPQLDFLKRFLVANPSAHNVRLGYARTLVAEKRYDDARKEFETLLRLNPENPDVLFAVGILSLQLNDVATAEKNLKHFMTLGQGEQDAARFYLGQIAEQAGRNDEALDWYRAVAAGEQKVPAHVRAAQLLVQQNKLDEARDQIAIARASTPTDTRLITAEAQLLRDASRFADAFDLLSRGLADQPEQPELLYEVALLAEKLGKNEVLESNLRKLIRLKPDYAHAYNALGYSLADRGERLDEAQRLIEKALELAPDDPYILDSKGWLLYRRGDRSGSYAVLNKALSLRPDPEIAAHVGEVLWSMGRREEALKTWNEAAKANPSNEVLATTIKKFVP